MRERIEPRIMPARAVSPAPRAMPATPRPGGRQAALHGQDGAPYDAASLTNAALADWWPYLGSPDLEINPWRDRIVARVRDLVRNDGWASGAVTALLDSAIGPDLRLVSKPDWQQLRLAGAAFDSTWAKEFGLAAQAVWRKWALDPGKWCDLSRQMTAPEIFYVAFRHLLIDGEALAALPWRPDRLGYGQANYATVLQGIDPDRLSNPHVIFDLKFMRGGVEINRDGAPVAYHIRQAHQGDWFNAPEQWIWDRIPSETAGRPNIVHCFEGDRFAQHRAAGGIFLPVVARMKMLAQYDKVELQAAVINAIFAAFIESPYDPNDVEAALHGDEGLSERNRELRAYQDERVAFHRERRLKLQDAVIPRLFPGEKIGTVTAARPSSNFEAFEGAVLRNFASAIGASYEQVSKDWSKSNYSSARGALLEAWKTTGRRRNHFTRNFCSPVYGAVLEEAMDRGELPLPANAPEFMEARGAYMAANWMGPGRGWVDPVKEAQAAVIRMDGGITTLAHECAEQGLDVEQVIEERAQIIAMWKASGMALPAWAHDVPAAQADTKPRAA